MWSFELSRQWKYYASEPAGRGWSEAPRGGYRLVCVCSKNRCLNSQDAHAAYKVRTRETERAHIAQTEGGSKGEKAQPNEMKNEATKESVRPRMFL